MKNVITICFLMVLSYSCHRLQETELPSKPDFSSKETTLNPKDSTLTFGTSYLSVYSDIYSYSEHTRHNLTATISLRNLSEDNSLIISRADYYDTSGNAIKNYFNKPIKLNPLETVNIIIDEEDESGGTGANFIFDWAIKESAPEPLFEAVMISTKGQQGLSFTTIGHRIR